MTTKPALSALDAFTMVSLPTEIGTPLVDKALFAALPLPPTGELFEKTARWARSQLGNYDAYANDAYERIVDKAARAGLTLPPRPQSETAFFAWTASVRSLVQQAAASDPIVLAAVELGSAAGDLRLALGSTHFLARLRSVAPEHAPYHERAVALAQQQRDAAQRLAAGLAAQKIPAVGRTSTKLAALLTQLPDAAFATTEKASQQIRAFALQIDEAVSDLYPALRLPVEAPVSGSPSEEEHALFAQILAQPRDNTLRRRYAELAARRNDPVADLIRAQLAIFELHQKDAPRAETAAHEARARDLIKTHPEWTAKLVRLGARSVDFYRGFIGLVAIDAADFLRSADAIFAAAPIEHLDLHNAAPHMSALAAAPQLARIRSLFLVKNELGDADIEKLVASPHVRGLRFLALTGNDLSNAAVEAIAASPNLRELRFLGVKQNPCDTPVDKFFYDENVSAWGLTDFGKELEKKHGPRPWLAPKQQDWPPAFDEID